MSLLCKTGCRGDIYRSPYNIAITWTLSATESCIQPAPPSSCERPFFLVQRDVRAGDLVRALIDPTKGSTMILVPGGASAPGVITLENASSTVAQVLLTSGWTVVPALSVLDIDPSTVPALSVVVDNVTRSCQVCVKDNKAYNLFNKPSLNPTLCGLVDFVDSPKFCGIQWCHPKEWVFGQQLLTYRFSKVQQQCGIAILKVFTYGIDVLVCTKQWRWASENQYSQFRGLRSGDQIVFTLNEAREKLEPTVSNSPGYDGILIFSPAMCNYVIPDSESAHWSDGVWSVNCGKADFNTRIGLSVSSTAS